MVQVAIKALQAFGAITASQAEELLNSWAHRDQLTHQERQEVLKAFK